MKKKLFILFISFFIISGCVNNKTIINQSKDNNDNLIEISIIPESYDEEKASFLIKNNSNYSYSFHPEYVLEIKENGKWKEIELEYPLTWQAVIYTLRPSDSYTFDVDWNMTYGKLEHGDYRLCKTFSTNQETITLYAEFSIPGILDDVS